jgi:hypothetical protein
MIIILKESEIFRDGEIDRNTAERLIEENFIDVFVSDINNSSSINILHCKNKLRRIDRDLEIQNVDFVKVVIITGE